MEARKPVFGKSNSVEDMQHESPSTFVNTLAAMCGRGPASPLTEAPGRVIMSVLFGFLQGFRP